METKPFSHFNQGIHDPPGDFALALLGQRKAERPGAVAAESDRRYPALRYIRPLGLLAHLPRHLHSDGAAEIAMRSRGTPRIANRLLRRVRDYAEVRASGKIDRPTAQAALSLLEVDAHGFDELDRRLLRTIIEKYDGGPVGLNTLAAALAEEQDALEEVYEPFLIQLGFLDRTPRGRVATRLAYEHLGIEMPRKHSLF